MLYAEKTGRGWVRVFSTKDSQKELDGFRCFVRAPRAALHLPKQKKDRVHLALVAKPAERAVNMLPPERVFATPIERATWERTQEDIVKRWREPFYVRS